MHFFTATHLASYLIILTVPFVGDPKLISYSQSLKVAATQVPAGAGNLTRSTHLLSSRGISSLVPVNFQFCSLFIISFKEGQVQPTGAGWTVIVLKRVGVLIEAFISN